jgi:hypothetical protein
LPRKESVKGELANLNEGVEENRAKLDNLGVMSNTLNDKITETRQFVEEHGKVVIDNQIKTVAIMTTKIDDGIEISKRIIN